MIEQQEIHEKIITILRERGPSLPIKISTEIGISSLFISAFLSELVNNKKVKVSHLKVGGSPLYFLEGQEQKLEEFYQFLHPRESEAFLLIKREKILKDSEQEPTTRVALRSIRDFAIGFKKNEEIYWRYFSVSDSEMNNILTPQKIQIQSPEKSDIHIKETEKAKEIKEPEKTEIQIKKPKKTTEKKKSGKKQKPEVFFEEVKSYLNQKNIEIINIENYNKKEIIIKIKDNNSPDEKNYLLFAYNKKTLTDKELLKAYKKSLQYNLSYKVLFKGEFSKKLNETINAYKNLISNEKI